MPLNVLDNQIQTPSYVQELVQEMRVNNEHGAHLGTSLEWWYLTGHLWAEKKQRTNIAGPQTSVCTTSLEWADDVQKNPPDFGIQTTFFYVGQGQQQGLLAQVAESNLKTGAHSTDQRAESFDSSKSGASSASLLGRVRPTNMDVRIANWKLFQLGPALPLKWSLSQTVGKTQWDLLLEPKAEELWLHGNKGYLQKVSGKGNFYASFPFVKATGVRTDLDSGEQTAVCGSVWFDHEVHVQAVDKVGWNWFAARLPDGRAFMIYQISEADGETKISGEMFDSASRQSFELQNIKIEAGEKVCLKSKNCFPMSFRMSFKKSKNAMNESILQISAIQKEQEMTALASLQNGYWEGAATVQISEGKTRGNGLGYMELVPLPK